MQGVPNRFRSPFKYRKFKKAHKKKELQRLREEVIFNYSEILDHMLPEDREALTNTMGDIVVTPRESFIAHFKNGYPKYEYEVFKIKFVEIFNLTGSSALKKVKYQKIKNRESQAITDFWRCFEVLFDNVGEHTKNSIFRRIKNFFSSIMKVIKWARRAIFLGIHI
ncbi:hypothetical protein MHC_00910 [Mycoplasma haemocanis str. Illinois]|uniref:Uncharacterized protein n=1 Tax=Mycoplasma haemocanis (strain Illinois) TaxID=1111676 RepID=H6N5T8_MYCHN|nr:hypothetical protein [Mycoplasma haemocanis]AEW45048.1 hypothetical protein MHC_00910 [Mycoplasma haemocanis str. Illinois]